MALGPGAMARTMDRIDRHEGQTWDSPELQAIVDDPGAYYVDVHTAGFENGAIRGQLVAPVEITGVFVIVAACPTLTEVTLSTNYFEERCSNVIRSGDVPPLRAGYTWRVKPTALDLDIEVDTGGDVRSIADASVVGDPSCTAATKKCDIVRSYEWANLLAGDTNIRQTGFPRGYALRSAIVYREGTPKQVISASGSSVTVDTTGDGWIQVVLFDLPLRVPQPAATVPPTSTLAVARSPSSEWSAPLLLLVEAVAAAVAIYSARRLGTRPERTPPSRRCWRIHRPRR
jgi:hypothetical protein